jgi:hypothetical protein
MAGLTNAKRSTIRGTYFISQGLPKLVSKALVKPSFSEIAGSATTDKGIFP